jgi:branched-subunit amino acid ABC-type transport system permease component
MFVRIVASHIAYASALVAAAVGVGLVTWALPFLAAVPGAFLLGFAVAAAIAAFACRRLGAVTPLSSALLVIVGGLLLLAYMVFVMRNISLPTGYPQTWRETASNVVGAAQIGGVLFCSFAAGLLLALARRPPHVQPPAAQLL